MCTGDLLLRLARCKKETLQRVSLCRIKAPTSVTMYLSSAILTAKMTRLSKLPPPTVSLSPLQHTSPQAAAT